MAFKCIDSLEENPKDLFLMVSAILLKLIDNVLLYPREPKYRRIRLENVSISKYVLPAIGGMECLFEIGFQEGDDSLILPEKVSVEKLKMFQAEIQKRRSKALNPKPADSGRQERPAAKRRATADASAFMATSTSQSTVSSSTTSASVTSAAASASSHKKKFLQQLEVYAQMVEEYEDKALQLKALSCVPLERLTSAIETKMRSVQAAAVKAGNATDGTLSEAGLFEAVFLGELMRWFKEEFFTWVNNPRCTFCQSKSTKFLAYNKDSKELEAHKTKRIEVYQCEMCANRLLFPRYATGRQHLVSRRGRCGEWAQCFTLFCRAFGYDSRLILDQSDHVWTEVYSSFEKRWIHCDPCECAWDSPLLYESGWKKDLSYIIAFSKDEVQDVTWRYTTDFKAVLQRRKECCEQELSHKVKELTDKKRSNVSVARLKYLLRRQVVELAEFLAPPKSNPDEKYGGRTSGSLEWRLLRGETTLNDSANHEPYIWVPSPEEVHSKVITVSYNCTKDEYLRGSDARKLQKCLSGWQNGLFQYKDVFRKEETDWETVYLCRTEQSNSGSLSWKFVMKSTNLEVDTVCVCCSSVTFNKSASIVLKLSGANTKLNIEPGEKDFRTADLRGETEITFEAELLGGEGNIAWQQAQLFRQPLKANSQSDPSSSLPFTITIMMRHKER